jgi:nucleotide-binding universal stress UspA family protein
MKILLAADGSAFTKKALAFLVNHVSLLNEADHLHVLHVQMAMPPRVRSVAGKEMVMDYHDKEADKVLQPIRKFLDRHGTNYKADWIIGNPAIEIVATAKSEKAHMIVMGTHGHGVIGQILMGSVAQRVVSHSNVPVLLVK